MTPPGNLQLALPAGVAPASVRLEDECLVDFGHGSIWKWSARQELHLRSLGPKPSALAATLRAVGPGAFTTPGAGEMQDTNPDNGPAVRLEIGGPEGSCTLIFPADNGALCWLSYGSGMVGGAGNAPVVASNSLFVTSDLQSGGWINSLKIGSGSGNHTHLKKFMRLLSVL